MKAAKILQTGKCPWGDVLRVECPRGNVRGEISRGGGGGVMSGRKCTWGIVQEENVAGGCPMGSVQVEVSEGMSYNLKNSC